MVAQFGGVDVVLPMWIEKRQRTKSFDDVFACARPRESLKQFLQNQPSGDEGVAALERLAQRKDLVRRKRRIAAKRERPDAGIDKQSHDRERPAL